ncbi:flagellar basal-body MS-ring/collar protein FliF [Nocardioides sp.]|uniref:flagellar basal-body MS-ring/collar protein FliF n=1 Tax=Nocardioides sp. TaxID=35761 RepID=UPI00351249AA
MAGFQDSMGRSLARYRRTFLDLTTGQKLVAVVGTAALLLGGFMVYRWASAPSYAPLFSDLSASDASAVVDELDAEGTPYQLAEGGTMVMVPRDQVYQARIALSAQGIPSGSDGGYSILDDQGLATSDFQEQTDYKRAMEGELATTIEAIDGVNTAVVHLALPQKQVFSSEQQPTTASVLVDTQPGVTLDSGQVQAIVNLVASSVEGLDPSDVTVADATGTVLSSPGDAAGTSPGSRAEQQAAAEQAIHDDLQAMLDRVVGPGNATVQVTADLDFDHAVTDTTDYSVDKDNLPNSTSTSTETYSGPGGTGLSGGVVGPDGQMDTGGLTSGGASSYEKTGQTQDVPVDVTQERRETPPGTVKSIHVGVALDAAATQAYSPNDIQALVQDAVGIDRQRGDTIRVLQVPFDRSAEEAAKADLAAATAADKAAATQGMIRTGVIAGLVLLLIGLALLRARKQRKAREKATNYVVEQIRADNAARAAALEAGDLLALGAGEPAELTEEEQLRVELDALIERQPDDVAMLLRGWLTERS